ncbi:MAG: hypothetical protein J6L02_06060 [Bacteroidales bacterium]|nr:hypothetical protein [Bacteroidales bacterium]
MKFINKLFLIGAIFIVLLASACGDLDEDGLYYSKQNTMVCTFSLQKNTEVLSNLDSIFFTIDLDKSLIYNADSLPKGTDVSAIAIVATFMNPANVYISYEDAEGVERNFSYLATSNAAVDFTKSDDNKVKMRVVAADGNTSQTYTLKVNVHKVVADSLYWKKIETTTISDNLKEAISAKCLSTENGYYLFAQDADGTLELYRTFDFASWESKGEVTLPLMDWRSLTVAGSSLYVLSQDNKLYVCSDIDNMTFVESSLFSSYTPISLIGIYDLNNLIAVVKENDVYKHASLNIITGEIVISSLSDDFPITGFSQPIYFSSKWTQSQLVIACGELQDGSLSNAVWGFDGTNWAILNNAVSGGSLITPRKGASLFTYYTYEYNSEIDLHKKVLTYFIIGGYDGNETLKDLYYTTNLGGKWKKAGVTSPMALPSEITPRMYADAFVVDESITTKSYGGSSLWRDIELVNTKDITKLYSLKSDEDQIVPYIYMVGGSNSLQYKFINEVWKGVIWRLTFPPIP